MPVELNLEFQTATAERNLRTFAVQTGIPVKALCKDQLRLWVQDFVKFLPPKTATMGKRAVADDIENVAAPLKRGAKEIELPDRVLIKSPSGAVWATEKGNLRPRIEGHHRSRRNRRGRTPRVPNSRQGGLTIVHKAHVEQADYRAYRKKVQEKVGKLKAGFLAAMQALGKVRAPAWVKKQVERLGGVSLNSMTDKGNGYVSATNRVSYAAKKAESFAPSLQRKRQLDITKGIWRSGRMRQLIQRFNDGKLT